MPAQSIKLYSLSTCAYCQAIKKMLADLGVAHHFVDADLIEGEKRTALLAELQRYNPRCSFPTIVIDGKVITGFKAQEIKETIGVRTEVDDLHDRLRSLQEPKGYYFNRDRERTFDLLRGLLVNKDRYGYLACPCRLASGSREQDRDIICPCAYREADVRDFGACYCALYVSRDWNEGLREQVEVPERRFSVRG